MRVIECGADQVVHARIHDHEALVARALHVDHRRDQHARIARDQAAGLEDDLASQRVHVTPHHGRIGVRRGRGRVVVAIGNAQAPTEIKMLDRVPFASQVPDQFAQTAKRGVERLQFHDLRADMHIDADRAETGQFGHATIDARGVAIGNAELGLRAARRDLDVGTRVDIRVDAARHGRFHTHRGRARGQQVQFGFGLDVEALDARRQRRVHLGRGLADAGEHDARGGNARRQGTREFAARHHVRPRTQRGEQREDRLVRVRLHGVAHERIEVGEGLAEHAVVPGDRRRRIAIERRADLARDHR